MFLLYLLSSRFSLLFPKLIPLCVHSFPLMNPFFIRSSCPQSIVIPMNRQPPRELPRKIGSTLIFPSSLATIIFSPREQKEKINVYRERPFRATWSVFPLLPTHNPPNTKITEKSKKSEGKYSLHSIRMYTFKMFPKINLVRFQMPYSARNQMGALLFTHLLPSYISFSFSSFFIFSFASAFSPKSPLFFFSFFFCADCVRKRRKTNPKKDQFLVL